MLSVKKMKSDKIGQDIIQFYKPYRRGIQKLNTIKHENQIIEIQEKYQIISTIGKGAYSTVFAIKNKKAAKGDKNIFALKKPKNMFDHKILTKRMIRQLKLTRLLKHQNIMGIETIILPKSRQDFKDLLIISQIMDSDLHTIIRKNPLNDDHHRFFLYQILKGLKYIHSANVVHRDLKPRNILINADCQLKICDLGLARILSLTDTNNPLTDYVMTRWYRAPELLLGSSKYTSAVDIWSVGCIFAQMIIKKPLLPGTQTKDQIQKMFNFFGVPDFKELPDLPRKSQSFLKEIAKKKVIPQKLEDILLGMPAQGLDLLKKMLVYNPSKRISAQEALAHSYFKQIHDINDQPSCDPIHKIQFEFQQYNLTTQQFKDILYEQILLYHNKQFKLLYEKKKKERQSLIKHILFNSNSKIIHPLKDNDDFQNEQLIVKQKQK